MVEGLGEVRSDLKKDTLEIQDLDPLACEEEVKREIRRALQNEQINPEEKVLNSNRRGLKLVVVVCAVSRRALEAEKKERCKRPKRK